MYKIMNKHTANFALAFGYNIHNPISAVLKDSFGEWKSFFFEEEMDNGKVYSIFITENQLVNIPYPIVGITDDILDLKQIKFFVENSKPVLKTLNTTHILSIN